VLPFPAFAGSPFNSGGRFFYSRLRRLSTSRFHLRPRSSLNRASPRCSSLPEEGRGFYLTAASRVNHLIQLCSGLDFFLPGTAVAAPFSVEGRGFYFVAALGVNILRLDFYFVARDSTPALPPLRQNHPPTPPTPARFPPSTLKSRLVV
jgi:hypothetical protein